MTRTPWTIAALATVAAGCLMAAAPSSAATRGQVIDETYSCTVSLGGSTRYVDVTGGVALKGSPAYAQVFTVLDRNADKQFVAQIVFDAAHRQPTIDTTHCRRTNRKPSLGRQHLGQSGEVTTTLLGTITERCAAPAHVLVRLRLRTNGTGTPDAGSVAVARDSRGDAPLAHLDWSRTRIRYAFATTCVGARTIP